MRRRSSITFALSLLLVISVNGTSYAANSGAASDPAQWGCGDAALQLDGDTVQLAPMLEDGVEGGTAFGPADSRGRWTPVVMVHGWVGRSTHSSSRDGAFSHFIDLIPTAGQSVSTGRSFIGQLQRVAGVAVFTFDYRDFAARWVDDSHLGPALGRVIDCLYQASGEKVIVVGHSMGGLIARYAASDRTDKISRVITFGTPQLGSVAAAAVNDDALAVPGLAAIRMILAYCGQRTTIKVQTGSACDILSDPVRAFDSAAGIALRYGSKQLAELKPWPPGITVNAFAGETTFDVPQGWFGLSWSTKATPVGDVIVTSPSALAFSATQSVANCSYQLSLTRGAAESLAVWVKLASDVAEQPLEAFHGPCFHSSLMRDIALTNAATRRVQEDVARRLPRYAFLSPKQLGVVHGMQVTAGAEGDFRYVRPHFTADGRYAFAVDHADESKAQIVAIDAVTGASIKIGCGGCSDAAAAGGSTVAWLDASSRIMRAELPAGKAMQWPGYQMPKPSTEFGLTPPRLAAVVGDRLVVDEDLSMGASIKGGSATILDPHGQFRRVEMGNIGRVAANSQGSIALVNWTQPANCPVTGTVVLVDPLKGTTRTTNIERLHPSGDTEVSITDLWYGRDNVLYATMSSGPCFQESAIASSLWRLENNTWTQVDAGPLLAVRQLSADMKAVALPSGKLYTEVKSVGTQVATDVVAIEYPPGL